MSTYPVCLGSNGGFDHHDGTTCLQIREDICIDAGTGLSYLSAQACADIQTFFITHSHLDHIASLPFLVNQRLMEQGQPIHVYASLETIKAMQAHIFNDLIWPDFSKLPNKTSPILSWHPVSAYQSIQTGSLEMTAIPVAHSVPSFGFHIHDRATGICWAFTGDSHSNDTFWNALNDLHPVTDVVCDCQYTNAETELSVIAGHYTPDTLAIDVEKLSFKPRIWISHVPYEQRTQVLEQARSAMPNHAVEHVSKISLIG